VLDLPHLLEWMRAIPWWAAYFALFVGSYGEYVVPFVPGDTIVVAGAVLVAVFGWPIAPVYTLITLGAVAGAVTAWYIGRSLDESGRIRTLSPRKQRAIAAVMARFDKYGSAVLAMNRFFPGIRGFFFVAAGITRVPLGRTIAFAAVSGAIWNALLIAIGWHIGSNLSLLERVLTRYGAATGVFVAVAVAFVAWRTWRELREAEPDRERNPVG
jgi:membrane protein DedA with SNARE-associated domain